MIRHEEGITELSPRGESPDIDRYFRDGEPDWEAIDFDVPCSRCGYHLRMLTQPRCPECGLIFDWREVLDRSAWQSDFLFEHHATTRPIRSYFKTLWKTLRPVRFWKQVSIHERIHVVPLLIVFGSAVVWFFVCFFGLAFSISWVVEYAMVQIVSASPTIANSPWCGVIQQLLWTLEEIPREFIEDGDTAFRLMSMLSLAWLGTLGLLCTLRQTLGRCRVRTLQLLRVTSYGVLGFSFAWASFILGGVVLVVFLGHQGYWDRRGWWQMLPGLTLMASFPLLLGIYVGAGLKHTLRLPRPYILSFTAALVGGLFSLTVNVLFGVN